MKKLLSLVLVLAMILSSAVFAFADDESYSEAINVIGALKIFEEDPQWTDNLTRGEAARLVAYMLLGRKAAEKLSAKAVLDVTADNANAKYIAYCYEQGIISGFNKNEFKAEETVTGYQYAKMMLACLGYKPEAEGMLGKTWEEGTVATLAKAGLTNFGAKAITKEEAAQLTFEALKANVVEYVDGVATEIENNAMNENIANDDVLQLGEDIFPELICAKTETGYAWVVDFTTLYEGETPVVAWVAEEDDETYRPSKNANSLPLLGILPWTKAEEIVLFSKDGKTFSPILTAKPNEKVYVKANRFTLDLKDSLTGAMPETLSSKTTPVELTLEKLYDIASLDESGRAKTNVGMDYDTFLKGRSFYEYTGNLSYRKVVEDLTQWLRVEYKPAGYNFTFRGNGLDGNLEVNGGVGQLGYKVNTDGLLETNVPVEIKDATKDAGINVLVGFVNGSPEFEFGGYSHGDKAGLDFIANLNYGFGTGLLFGNWFKPNDMIKITTQSAVTLSDLVQNFNISVKPVDGLTVDANVGIDGTNPYVQLQGKYESDALNINTVADASEYGTVIMADANLKDGEAGVYANVTYKDINAVTKLNTEAYLETELNNAIINAIEMIGESQGKDLTIQLHLETEPKAGEAAVYSFKMPDRMVTADDFGQGYMKNLTFYNGTFKEQTVLVKDGEYGDIEKVVVEPFKTATIAVSDGQKTYITVDAVPTTLTDMLLGTNDIDATFGKTLEISGGARVHGLPIPIYYNGEKWICAGNTDVQEEATLAITDATTFNLGGTGVCTGDKLIVLNGRLSPFGVLSVRPYIGINLND